MVKERYLWLAAGIITLCLIAFTKSDREKEEEQTLKLQHDLLNAAIVKGWQRGLMDMRTSDSIDTFYNRLAKPKASRAQRFVNNVYFFVNKGKTIHYSQLDSIEKLELYRKY